MWGRPGAAEGLRENTGLEETLGQSRFVWVQIAMDGTEGEESGAVFQFTECSLALKKKIKTKTGNKIISNIETNKQKKKIYINIIYTIQHKQKLPGKIFPLG